ncbi:phospholipase D-like domain-containing protein [Streptomyces sp. NPDC006393]|uniref:phospholipase D-like domain-containing protein n=1 Tax=Streptomyces sp. NPDC006393 TaxID=3156763 RepID=UPI0033E6797C
MARHRHVLSLTTAVLALLAGLLAAVPASAAGSAAPDRPTAGTTARTSAARSGAVQRLAAAPDIVMNAPVFNDPTDGPASGTPTTRQAAVFDQLLGLISAVPSGGEIRLAMHEWTPGASTLPQQVADRLIDAHAAGVHVRIILNTSDKNQTVRQRLDAALGHDESKDSWVVGCADYSGTARGCLARDYLHDKFATFSSVTTADGGTVEDVVFQSSSNLSDWYLFNSYNEAYTLSDARVYDGYVTYFGDLRAGRHAAVNPDYFWATPTGGTYKGMYYPRDRATGDTIVNVLRLVQCSYTDGGTTHQTDIRIVMNQWTKNRLAIADELLRLRGENCWVDIVYPSDKGDATPLEHEVRDRLSQTASNGKKIQLTRCRFTTAAGAEVVPHDKVMLTDGRYDQDIVPRVYMGSANFTTLENSDDSQLRVMGRGPHDLYLHWFYGVRDTCRSHTPQ